MVDASLYVYQSPRAAMKACNVAGAAMRRLVRRGAEMSKRMEALSMAMYGMAKSMGCSEERS